MGEAVGSLLSGRQAFAKISCARPWVSHWREEMGRVINDKHSFRSFFKAEPELVSLTEVTVTGHARDSSCRMPGE